MNLVPFHTALSPAYPCHVVAANVA